MNKHALSPQVQAIIHNRDYTHRIKVDRAFCWLMIAQWIFGIFAAWFISPYTWLGETAQVHIHVWAAIFFGGAICLFPILFVRLYPGTVLSGHVMAVAQMIYSSLLIHLLGGRIESHFHIFGSLAFLAYYRNISVLMTASAVVIADHFVRGYIYPMSIYGVASGAEWRWLEHTAWVLFEDAFLAFATLTFRRENEKSAIYECELIKEKERALALSEVKTRFLSNMSHEIRTPLNSIIGFSELLTTTPLDEEQELFVGTINRCSESLLGVVNDVLDLSKIESGRLEIEHAPFSIHELQKTLRDIFESQSEQKGLTFTVQTEGSWPALVVGDSLRIRQVLINLIGNAVKFTQHGSIQVLLTRPQEDLAMWQVRDSGIGIRPENMEHIFGPFNQEDASVARRFGGTGLGLTICKNLVEQMGGKIEVWSKFGEGTTFTVTLPISPVEKIKPLPSSPGAVIDNR